jgi:TolB-like protein
VSNVFVSHGRAAEAAVRKVTDALHAAGHEVWSDADLPAHRPFSEVIEEKLNAADAVLVLWSDAAGKSQWVRAEAEYAREHGKLVQALLDGGLPPMPFNQTQCARLAGWSGDRRNPEWRKVLQSLEQMLAAGPDTRVEVAAGPAPSASAPPRPRFNRRGAWLALAGVLLLAVLGGGVWFLADLNARERGWKDPHTAVLPFKALSPDAQAREFAAAADSDLNGVLEENQLKTLPASRASDAAFVVSGTVQSDPGRLHVRLRLEDPRAHAALWSTELDHPATDAAGMRAEIGRRVGRMVRLAVSGRRLARGSLTPDELAILLKGQDQFSLSFFDARPAMEELARRRPDVGPAQASLCMLTLTDAMRAPHTEFESLRARGRSICERALRLDPSFTLSYYGLSVSEDGRQWARREAYLQKAVVVNPAGGARGNLGMFLMQVGREDEAVDLLRQGFADDPSDTLHSAYLAFALALAGRQDEAAEFSARELALQPQDGNLRLFNLIVHGYAADPSAAQAILDDPLRRPAISPAVAASYRAFLAAKASGSAADRKAAIATILSTAGTSSPNRTYAIGLLAALGALDDAFGVADAYANDPMVVRMGFSLTPYPLFMPKDAVEMRADPRFIPLVKRLGLFDYWRTSGHWPDFCAHEPKSVCAEMQREAQAIRPAA